MIFSTGITTPIPVWMPVVAPFFFICHHVIVQVRDVKMAVHQTEQIQLEDFHRAAFGCRHFVWGHIDEDGRPA